jgi:glycine cleavage system H protein
MVALLFLVTVAAFLTVEYVARRRRGRRARGANVSPTASTREAARVSYDPYDDPTAVVSSVFRLPDGVFFGPGHTWVFLEESGTARVGVDDFARSLLGSIDRVVSHHAGQEVSRGDVVLTLHHGNRWLPVRSPIEGMVEDVNASFAGRRPPGPNDSVSGEWLYRIKPNDTAAQLGGLHLGSAAREWIGREVDRLKVMLATLRPGDPVLGATMQDGGSPVWGLCDHLTDEEWRQIQNKILLS